MRCLVEMTRGLALGRDDKGALRLVEMTEEGLGWDVRFLDFARNDRELGREDKGGSVGMTKERCVWP